MRDDLHKVVTERPRSGPRNKTLKGSRRDIQGDKFENCGTKESMTKPYIVSWNDRQFTDLLGPLKRYILSCVGRKWDDVYSEICKKFPETNMSYKHVKGHLTDYVLIDFLFVDGNPCHKLDYRYTPMYGKPYYEEKHGPVVWVHPVTGILTRFKKNPNKKSRRQVKIEAKKKWESEKKVKKIGDKLYSCVDGIWYEVFLKDAKYEFHYDLAQQQTLYTGSMQSLYGKKAYVASKRQLGRKALKKLCLENNNLAV